MLCDNEQERLGRRPVVQVKVYFVNGLTAPAALTKKVTGDGCVRLLDRM